MCPLTEHAWIAKSQCIEAIIYEMAWCKLSQNSGLKFDSLPKYKVRYSLSPPFHFYFSFFQDYDITV